MPNEKPITENSVATPSELELEFRDGIPSTLSPMPSAIGPSTKQGETVADRLKRIYPEHYVRIITHANYELGSTHTAELLGKPADIYKHNCLAVMFTWHDSPEGSVLWAKLSEREHPDD